MSKEHLKIRKGVLFTPQSSPPVDPTEGDAYFDAVLGLRLYKNNVWQSAGGAGEIKVDIVDRTSVTLPTTVPTSIDGILIATDARVLFTNLSSNNNRVYKASVSGTISWSAEPDFGGLPDPTSGDVVRVKSGTVYKLAQFLFDGTNWLWSLVDYDDYTIGSTGERLSKLYGETLDIAPTAGLTGIQITGNTGAYALNINGATGTYAANIAAGSSGVAISMSSNNNSEATVDIRNTGTGGIFDLRRPDNGGILKIKIPATLTTHSLTMPVTLGSNGQVLSTDASGVLSWTTIASTLQDAYNNDIDGSDVLITTNATDGSLVIAGTEGLSVTADKGISVTKSSSAAPGLYVTYNGTAQIAARIVASNASNNSTGLFIQHFGTSISASAAKLNSANAGGATLEIQNSDSTGYGIALLGSTSGVVNLKVPNAVTSHNLTLPSAQGTIGQKLTNDGFGALSWEDPVLGFNAWTVINSNTVAAAADDFGVNTSGGTVDVTFPATPANGSRIRIVDRSGTFATNSCFIKTTDGSTIEGAAQPLEIDVDYIWAEFVYDSAATNWVIYGPLAAGPSPTLQDLYNSDATNNPVLITTTITQGDLEINGTEQLKVTSTKGLLLGGNFATARLSFAGSTSGILGVKVPAVVTPYDITLPSAVGTAGQYLQTDASGVLSWATVTVPTVTLQSAYIGSNILTSSAPEGNISFGGTEKFEVTTVRGMLISSPGSSGEPTFHVLNSGTIAEAVLIGHNSTTTIKDALSITNAGLGIGIKLLNTNAGNTDSALEITNTANTSSITINQNGNSQGLTVIQSVTATSAAMRLVAQNAQNRQIDMQSSGGGTLGFRTSAGTVGHNYTWPATQAVGTQILENNGSGILSWVTAPTTQGWVTSSVAGAGPHVVVNYDEKFVDTTAAVAVVTMPAAAKGLRIRLIDDVNNWATNNVTVNGNGADTFDGAAGPLTLNVSGRIVELLGDTGNWRVIILK